MPAQVTAAPGAPSADEKLQQVRRQLLADFKAADSNHDGYLSPEEVRERFPGIARNFMLADEDRDGRISPQEYLRFRRLQAERRLGKHGD
jgi:Ca2+-binding EF-hand superfamily protein